MKTKIMNGWRVLLAIAIAASAAACSDGELAKGVDTGVGDVQPQIVVFAADPAQIKAGDTTTISWEVINADSVEITAVPSDGKALSFHVQSSELKGTAPAAGLTSTTDFTLTATKKIVSTETSGDGTAPAGGAAALSINLIDSDTTMGGQIQFGEEPLPLPSESEKSASQTIKVTVAGGNPLTVDAKVKDPSVVPGDCTILSWTVTPSDPSATVTTTVTGSDGVKIVATDKCESNDVTTIEQEVEVTPTPAVGCAVVCPTQDTTYTVSASDDKGGTGSADAKVSTNMGGGLTAKIAVGDSANPTDKIFDAKSFDKPITVAWEVNPASAKITIESDSIEKIEQTTAAPCDLPKGVTDPKKAKGSTQCMLKAKTKFKLTAELGGKTATDEALVTINAGGIAGLVIAEQWALENEHISITMDLTKTAKANPSVIKDVLINSVSINTLTTDKKADATSAIESLQKNGTIMVKDVVATMPQVGIELVASDDSKQPYNDRVRVVGLEMKRLTDEVAVRSLSFASDDSLFMGMQLTGWKDGEGKPGMGRIYHDFGPLPVPFGAEIVNFYNPGGDLAKGNYGEYNPDLFAEIGTYPAVVTPRENNPSSIYVGITGAIMQGTIKKDGNSESASWEPMGYPLRRKAAPGESPNHATCGYDPAAGGQKTQKGMANQRTDGGQEVVSLSQVCDILAPKSGSLIVATDFGVMASSSSSADPSAWTGIPANGTSDPSLPMFMHVVNDLEMADGKVYAAADNGVFVSSNDGKTWTSFTTISGPVFSLYYDASNKTLYAGKKDGISSYSFENNTSSSWTPKGLAGTAVLSIVVDQSSDLGMTVLAGTPTGVQITRDGGQTWEGVDLIVDKVKTQVPVEALALMSKGDGKIVNYAIAIGSRGGAKSQTFAVMQKQASQDTGDNKQPGDDKQPGDNTTPGNLGKTVGTLARPDLTLLKK